MLVALMVGFLAIGLVFAWLLIHRFRVAWLEQQADRVDLDAALAARRASRRPRRPSRPPRRPPPSRPPTTVPTVGERRRSPPLPREVTSR